MTDEYINKKDVVNLGVMMQTHLWTREQTYNAIFCLPSADVAPVRHGRWMPLVDCSNAGIYCSLCHKKVFGGEYSNTMKLHSAYCPNCGARMDGESDDE